MSGTKSTLPLYYVYGDDTEVIEKKWLPDFKKKFPEHTFFRYDASIDDISPARITTELTAHDLFSHGKVVVIRNADSKSDSMEALLSAMKETPPIGNALVLLASGLNKTTKLGKLASQVCVVREFKLDEIKPFDLLDAINTKNTGRILQQTRRLFEAEYSVLMLYSLLCGHLLLMRKVKERQAQSPEEIARELKEHIFRIKKMVVANRYWSADQISQALAALVKTGDLLRTWQYDDRMLLEMFLISITL